MPIEQEIKIDEDLALTEIVGSVIDSIKQVKFSKDQSDDIRLFTIENEDIDTEPEKKVLKWGKFKGEEFGDIIREASISGYLFDSKNEARIWLDDLLEQNQNIIDFLDYARENYVQINC